MLELEYSMGYLDSVRRELAGLWSGGKEVADCHRGGVGLVGRDANDLPALLPYFSDDFGLTLTTAGLLVSIIWLAQSIGQVPGGILADRYSERKILTASVSVTVVGLAVVVSAPSALVLFAATAVVGFGLSQYPVARMTMLSDLYPSRLGRALGMTMASADLGQTVLPPIASVLAVVVGWQFGLGYVLPFLCLSVVGLWWTLPKSEPEDDGTAESNASIREVVAELCSPTIAIMGVMLFLFLFVWQTFSAFYPTYLVDEKGSHRRSLGPCSGCFRRRRCRQTARRRGLRPGWHSSLSAGGSGRFDRRPRGAPVRRRRRGAGRGDRPHQYDAWKRCDHPVILDRNYL